MFKRSILFTCVVLFSLMTFGKTITITDTERQPIADVLCVGYSVQGDSITSWITDANGAIDISGVDIDHIVASHAGFSDKIIFMKDLAADNNQVVLPKGVELSEVVVTPADMEEFSDHTTYRLSAADMARYPNVYQALNEIPNLTVLTNGALFFEGSQNVKILLDGVETTRQEVSTLSKDDIYKIEVYQMPPLRFIAQGVSAVLNIRLKSKLHGGNMGIDITQAFQSLKGNNSAALYYNYRQSRFSLLYNNQNTHFRKLRRSETLDYDFDGVNYKKEKEGLDSKTHYDDNNLSLSYQINKPGNFLYNVKAGVDFNRDDELARQKVTTANDSFLATNRLRTDYNKFLIGNYFEKNLGEKAGTLLANINYQHFATNYNSAYNELTQADDALHDSHSKYKTNFDAIFSEIQYQLPYSKIGRFSFSAFENYKHSRYVDTRSPFYQTVNTLGALAMWSWWKGNVSWYASMGFGYFHTASTTVSTPQNICVPTPRVNLFWRVSRSVQLSLNYSYSGSVPSIAQLSETNQWLDNRLVYHGNATLKPYKTHTAGIRINWNIKYVSLSMQNSFSSSPGMICDMYTVTDQYMLQTLVNLSSYRSLGTTVDLSIMPLGNNRIVFWNRVILSDIRGKNPEYSWKGYRFQWMSDLAFNLKHWTIDLFYQYPGKTVEGQLERPRAQCWSATVLYRPMTNLSVGLEWFMPFGNGFKESERTVNSAPVYANSEYNVLDRNNMLSLKFSYYFNFGRNNNRARPQYDNGDSDTGILRKY